jgi:hypothetical protein
MQLKPIAAIIVLSLVVASLLVAGCTVNVPSTSTPTPTVKATLAATPAASAASYALKVNSMTTSSQLKNPVGGSTPSPGKTYAVFDVTVTNKNKNNLYMGSPLDFQLTTSDGTVYPYSSASYWLDDYITGLITNPGERVTGKIAFEIPQSAKPTKLTYSDLTNGVVITNL